MNIFRKGWCIVNYFIHSGHFGDFEQNCAQLTELNEQWMYAEGYVDDIVILVRDKHMPGTHAEGSFHWKSDVTRRVYP